MNNNVSPLVTSQEAANILGVKNGTLSVWRCTDRYELPFIKVGRKVMYRIEDIQDFINSNIHDHT